MAKIKNWIRRKLSLFLYKEINKLTWIDIKKNDPRYTKYPEFKELMKELLKI